ncbi:hypothetical protein [Shewanella gelidii]|uniref:Uncharacterized protein n=1 Tax=Shewanella gelidii TaxID=1642821 RepID=A0A917JKC8_9GAMM|nr:hypothetical protein [Shewanella gelidii]MCL1096691.1 hypothetical protein [Shewanella gelidii]GGI69527.1 hypothetical protein GCM10009332_03260 [Shewanella gelidii]
MTKNKQVKARHEPSKAIDVTTQIKTDASKECNAISDAADFVLFDSADHELDIPSLEASGMDLSPWDLESHSANGNDLKPIGLITGTKETDVNCLAVSMSQPGYQALPASEFVEPACPHPDLHLFGPMPIEYFLQHGIDPEGFEILKSDDAILQSTDTK